jgi:hypothetical protein
MDTRKQILGFGFLLMVLSTMVVFLIESFKYTILARRFPLVVCAFLAIVGAIDLLRYLGVLRDLATGEGLAKLKEAFKIKDRSALYRWLQFILVIVGYFVLLPTVGFIISSLLLSLAFPFILKKQFTWVSCLIFVSMTIVIYVVFAVLLYVPLPGGIWG